MKLRLRRRPALKGQKGQSMLEYLLVMFMMVSALLVIMGKLRQSEFFFKRFTEPLVKHIAYNYKYGDPTAQGWDEGTPKMHIQIQEPAGSTFRLFQPQKD